MRKIVVILLVCFATKGYSGKMPDAFEALSIFDYFKAKQLFYKSLSKHTSQSAFGLSIIYFRTDNPFSNIDSAAKYITIAKNEFKDTITHSSFHINLKTINELAISIGANGFKTYGSQNNVQYLNHFLSHFYFADSLLIEITFEKRDGLYLSSALGTQSSDSLANFLKRFPQSTLYPKAKKLFYDFQYLEKTPQKTIQEYQLFIRQFPKNPNVEFAETSLFYLVQNLHSPDSIYNFIKHYSTQITLDPAWKLLYSTSVKHYNKEELTAFLTAYPDYPFNETILKEISLSKNILVPLKDLNDTYGYIDTLGNWIISAQYDDALAFSEGFASVCINDSCFYINKEGRKISVYSFEEAENYKDGVAIVKKDNDYFLINRSGQYISEGYQDMNRRSENLYVCKARNMYGAINAKGQIVIPFSYNKLGNFNNGYAYYLAAQCGLVDINNKTTEAKWDWISEVDVNAAAIVKKENKFGLVSVDEQLMLPTEYDYIAYCVGEIYLVVKNNLYGFFNIKGKCFVTSVEYSYNSAFEPNYYTNGTYFKLLKGDGVALIDANGRYSINFNTYSNLFFAQNDIIRIQKNNKFGYVDRKLKAVTHVEFDKATDYANGVAIVTKSTATLLIDKNGKMLFSIKNGEIAGSEKGLYTVKQNGLVGLLNADGKFVLNIEFTTISLIYDHLYVCVKNNELYLFNLKTKLLRRIK